MTWWRRRRAPAPQPGDDRPDAHLSPLTVGQAAQLRVLVRRTLAELGLEGVPEGDRLRLADGRVLGLVNLARAVAHEPASRWPAVVGRHTRIMLDFFDTPLPTSLEEARDRLYLRLVTTGDVPPGGCVRSIGADLVQAAAVDHPEHVATVTDAALVEHLGGWDALTEAGLANLSTLRADQTRRWVDPVAGAEILVSIGGFFNASRLLVLPVLLAQDFGVERPAHGVLLVVPNRHLLAAHVLVGVDETIVAVRNLAALAAREHAGVVGPLSPNVYFWRDGEVQQVTTRGPGGELTLDATGAFGQAMTEVGLRGGEDGPRGP